MFTVRLLNVYIPRCVVVAASIKICRYSIFLGVALTVAYKSYHRLLSIVINSRRGPEGSPHHRIRSARPRPAFEG